MKQSEPHPRMPKEKFILFVALLICAIVLLIYLLAA